MKIAFILLICLSFFGCSKEQKTETVPQNNEVQESMSIEQPMGIEEITQIEEEPHQTEENKLASEAFEKYRLVVSIEGERRSSALFVEFLDENTYCFCSPFGGYLWSDLAYTASEDTLSFSKFSLYALSELIPAYIIAIIPKIIIIPIIIRTKQQSVSVNFVVKIFYCPVYN